ncbi:TPA: hypothetical protein DCZ39_01015 [Patescibacteria group bacterium]|nr:hypothetical protein [Candidatus Gracilibacteria bacterium]
MDTSLVPVSLSVSNSAYTVFMPTPVESIHEGVVEYVCRQDRVNQSLENLTYAAAGVVEILKVTSLAGVE